VSPATSTEDQPVSIIARGFPPHRLVTLTVWSTDATGRRFVSRQTYLTDAHGAVDVARRAPASGYGGAWGMGPLVAMQPVATAASSGQPYLWGRKPQTFVATLTAKRAKAARAVFTRHVSAARETLLRPAHGGIYAEEFLPPHARSTGIVLLGGSEGGAGPVFLADVLAAHGYPTMAVGYFNESGLPPNLSSIRLEYFAAAIRRLRAQPGVRRIVVVGASRGSEAALLLGVHFPSLVDGGVVATVPSSVVNCGFPSCTAGAWTLHGKALPYAKHFGDVAGRGAIPVERIHVPVFLLCAGADEVWNSCAYAHAIARRMGHGYELHVAPTAGHFVGALVPYEPDAPDAADPATERARERVWPQLLAFLARI
jgi:pimeloyl-ACP methyl ester carboxylesterase